jgi:hypothetical protein
MRGGGVIKEFDIDKNTSGSKKINMPINLQS